MNKFLFGFILSIVLFSILFSVLGCVSSIENGEVVATSFVPEHEEEREDPDITIGDITIHGGTYTVTIPDKWFATFEKVDEDGKMKQRTVQITKNKYNSLKVGDWISVEK